MLTADEYEEYRTLAYHEVPPVMYFFDREAQTVVDIMQMPEELRPCADVSVEVMEELEAEAEGMKTHRVVTMIPQHA